MAAVGPGNRNVRTMSASSLLTGTYTVLLQAVLQPFVVGLTQSVSFLSTLQALGNRFGGIVGSLSQLVGGRLTDRWGRRPAMLLGSAFNMAALTLLLATAVSGWWPALVPAFMCLGLALVASPASQSAVAESVEVRGRAMAYSKVQFFLVLPSTFMAFLGGFLAERYGYALIFAVALGLEGVNFALFSFVLKETLRERNHKPLTPRSLLRFPEPRLRGLLVLTTVDSFVWQISSMIIYGMAVERYGFTVADIGIIVGVSSVVFAAATLPVGKLVERSGCRWMMFFSESLGIPVMLGWIFATTPLQFAAISVFGGLTGATWVPAWQTYLANAVGDRTRGEATGQIIAIRGLLAFPAPLLGGFLYATLGYPAPMIASFVGVILAMVLVLRYIH